MLGLLGHDVGTVKRLEGGLTPLSRGAYWMEKVREAPVNMATCLGNLREGDLGNKKTVERWRGCEAKGAASEQQIRYEAVYEWPGKIKHTM